MDFLETIGSGLNWIINLGAAAMMPIIFFVFALILGVKPGKALKSGLMVGIGFTGLNTIINLMTEYMSPASQSMVENSGLNLTVLDVGWPAASAIAYGSMVGILMIPVGMLVNVLMLLTKTTKTINIDIWNYWHFAFTGSLIYALTENLLISLALASINMIIIMVIGDRTQPQVEKVLGLKGISVPHAFSGTFAPIAWIVNKVMDRIPGVNKIHLDEQTFKKRFGIFGDPAILGALVGVLIGVLARYSVAQILQLAVVMAAVLVLMPKMAAAMMEGLTPVSESLREKLQKRFKGNTTLYIGLDSAVGVGNPVVLTVSTVMIPITVLLAFLIPGNDFLPFASLSGLTFMFVLIVPLVNGDFFRSLVVGIISMVFQLLLGTAIAELFTKVAAAASFSIPEGSSLISSIDYGSSWIPNVIVYAMENGWVFVSILSVFTLLLMLWNRKKILEEARMAEQQ
ncbi:PTS galactitol transporter subunit IIC [Fervidibacillus albus]|uniref:PTS galactitol transporter subunit IIC n=1 Tax=Fervidibacillus albus TaxID=2980026 RepID=A0A9E8RVV5_9BACI|nr:PTS transporter subunit IIC [Fervidibacillus albus]WAA09363.1 PTS galactitol transporter subunit IIC [Fervidibacillus albus]